MERDKLLGSMDAKVWTDEFMATKARLGDEEFDHAMMLAWFANAIMAGFDEANRRAQRALDAEREKAKQLDRTLADVYQQRDGLQAQLRQVEGAYQKLLNVIDDSHDEDLPIEIIEARDEAYKFLVAQDAKPRKCPTCDSPSPHLHPAVQHEGEVQVCSNRWHKVAQDAGKAVSSG